MNKTDIDYGTYDWNPVTGCDRGCGYCFARDIATRFGGGGYDKDGHMFPESLEEDEKGIYVLNNPIYKKTKTGKLVKAPYPFGFAPTFHRYRLNELSEQIYKPGRVLITFMGDLFNDNIPDGWIQQVFDACEKAPWNKYIFLTKNPERYISLTEKGLLREVPNFWYGETITKDSETTCLCKSYNMFLSIEPLHGEVNLSRRLKWPICKMWGPEGDPNVIGKFTWVKQSLAASSWSGAKWVIIGAETGNRKEKVIPKREWIESIVDQCRAAGVPVFMKKNLAAVWGEELIQEYPEGLII